MLANKSVKASVEASQMLFAPWIHILFLCGCLGTLFCSWIYRIGHCQGYMDFWSWRTLKITWREENKDFVFIVSVYLCAWSQQIHMKTLKIFLHQITSLTNQGRGGFSPVLKEFNVKIPDLVYPGGQHASCRTNQIVTSQENEKIWATHKTDVFSYIL